MPASYGPQGIGGGAGGEGGAANAIIPDFSNTESYIKDQLVYEGFVIYRATKDIPAGNFDVNEWDALLTRVTLGTISSYTGSSTPHYLGVISNTQSTDSTKVEFQINSDLYVKNMLIQNRSNESVTASLIKVKDDGQGSRANFTTSIIGTLPSEGVWNVSSTSNQLVKYEEGDGIMIEILNSTGNNVSYGLISLQCYVPVDIQSIANVENV